MKFRGHYKGCTCQVHIIDAILLGNFSLVIKSLARIWNLGLKSGSHGHIKCATFADRQSASGFC